MDLSHYIQDQGGTAKPRCAVIAAIAQKAGCSAGTLYMITKGHKQASPRLAVEIERATDEQVLRQVLRPDVFGVVPGGAVEP